MVHSNNMMNKYFGVELFLFLNLVTFSHFVFDGLNLSLLEKHLCQCHPIQKNLVLIISFSSSYLLKIDNSTIHVYEGTGNLNCCFTNILKERYIL